ncbi:FAD-dependent monooxygenase [Streptomyces sp. NPDC002623]
MTIPSGGGDHGCSPRHPQRPALGWALAAVLKGWGTPGLLSAYEQERRSVPCATGGPPPGTPSYGPPS